MLLRFLIIFCFVGCLSAQNPYEKGSPLVTALSSAEYGGEEQNFNFAQDDKGVLYVTNSIGFLEFNGAKWRHFKPDNDGVPIGMAKDEIGRIYAGGTSLIGYLDHDENGQTHFVSLKHLLPKDFKLEFIWKIIAKRDKIYFQNYNNILVFDGTSITIIDCPYYIQNIILFNDSIVVDTVNGLYKIVNGALYFIEGTDVIGSSDVRDIIGADFNDFTVFVRNKGIYDYVNKKLVFRDSPLSHFLKLNFVYSKTDLTDGTIAITTVNGGVLIVDQNLKPLYRINMKGGLTDDLVRGVYQDYDDNLWVATDNGISKLNFPVQSTFYKHDEDDLGTILKMTRFRDQLYISTMKGIYKLNPSTEHSVLSDNPYANIESIDPIQSNSFALTVMQDKLIYGGLNTLKMYDGSKSIELNKLNARVFYKSLNNPNLLFVGHKFGTDILIFKDGNVISQINIKDVDTQIRGVAEDAQGNIWLTSMSDGVFKVILNTNLETESVKHYKLEDGLPSLRDNLVYNIEDKKVIFTTHKGFYNYDYVTDTFVPSDRFGEEYKGTDEFVYAFDFVNKDKAWIHSYRKRESSLYTNNGNGYNLQFDAFREFSHIPMYYIYDDNETSVAWFGGPDLVRFDESVENNFESKNFNAVISQAIIAKDSLIVSGHHFNKENTIQLESKFKDIRFEVGATDYNNFDKNEYQYLLEGYDSDWSPWTNESFKIYTNLNSGDYTFKVRAKNVFKTLSNEDVIKFSITPFWYEELWFKFLLVLLAIVVIGYITNYFSKRKFVKRVHEIELQQKYEDEKSKAIMLEKDRGLKAMIQAQENERGRIARDLHDGVVQQIGSVILKARSFVDKYSPKEKNKANTFLKDLENSNQELRNISHQMMPRALKDLGMISAISDMLENSLTYSEIQYQFEHFNIDSRLSERIEVTVYRITQELINNIIKHSDASHVNVQLFKTENDIILIVEDDGVGIKKKESDGIGLLNISSRVDMMQGTVNFEPSPNSGTLVTVKIPITDGN